ncbi:S-adenosyl-L-methionine-dependent methyltransferase [Rhodocollybia butyracea]|uniref:Protein-lysine N-methyltransferase EFM4 n=1 Tax=Rhodocollybia butyracea TaxID=206335 RepID=A0A9P5Q267_9AGAR|nr:S-adenosyl-L-methionine-dependent methyltransferase [Rhodocollybia butyracea]
MGSIEFEASRLGTKEHWDSVYSRELTSFKEIGDEGEVWFGEESVYKMVQWAAKHVPPSNDPMILDIGSGNGALLFSLFEDENYSPKLLYGIDYSEDAVILAKNIAQKRGAAEITFNICDFLSQDPPIADVRRTADSINTWDLLLDKGTYDAIALGEKDNLGRSSVFSYPSRAARLIKPGGFFLITSCNFTEQELRANFATEETGLLYHSSIKYATFTFGGQSGAKYSSIAFQKTTQ